MARDVDRERGGTAVVLGHLAPVDVDLGAIVDAPEVEQQAAACPRSGHVERAVIPDGGDEVLAADAREGALRTEGHGDLVLESLRLEEALLHPTLPKVELVGPRSVEALPLRALELRARIFGAGHGCGRGATDGGHDGHEDTNDDDAMCMHSSMVFSLSAAKLAKKAFPRYAIMCFPSVKMSKSARFRRIWTKMHAGFPR